jgi:hypothetical protein
MPLVATTVALSRARSSATRRGGSDKMSKPSAVSFPARGSM